MTKLPVTGAFNITATYLQKGSYWKNGHQGIDFTAPDHRVYATCNGTVRLVAYDEGGWGQYVSIGDDSGRRHIFCHLVKGSVKVKAGQKVTPLTVIGTMGATGNVTGLHLHYQLQQGENVIDPCAYLGIPNKIGSYISKDFEEVENMTFKDEKDIPAWAADAVKKVSDKGLMLGDDQGNFRPNDPITRAEMAILIARMMNL